MGYHFLLQGIFPTQGSNPCVCIDRQILSHWATATLTECLANGSVSNKYLMNWSSSTNNSGPPTLLLQGEEKKTHTQILSHTKQKQVWIEVVSNPFSPTWLTHLGNIWMTTLCQVVLGTGSAAVDKANSIPLFVELWVREKTKSKLFSYFMCVFSKLIPEGSNQYILKWYNSVMKIQQIDTYPARTAVDVTKCFSWPSSLLIWSP